MYRIGAPFSAAEKDSLQELGIDFLQMDWTVSQLQDAIALDSLQAGVLQPNFFEEDEDMAATALSRGGWVGITSTEHYWNKKIGNVLLDQDPTTSWVWPALAAESFDLSSTYRSRGVLLVLGGRFLVREVRFRPAPDRPDHFFERFKIGVKDEGFDTFRIPWFPTLIEVKENTSPDVRVILDPPITIQSIQLEIIRDTPKEIGIADLEIYGGGFVGAAAYESDVIDLENLASFGEIHWSGRQDFLARVDIRTRTGTDPQPEILWKAREEQQDSVKFLQGGGTLNFTEYKRQYGKISEFLKPVNIENWASPDTENWSFFSSPYDFLDSGIRVVSEGPKQFIQIRADFTSTVTDGGKIDYIQFKASVPPSVRRLVGEIFPTKTTLGEPTSFTYYITPTIRSGDLSFDGVEISTPSGVQAVDSLRIGGIDQREFSSTIDSDGSGFELMLPRELTTADSGTLIEVVFRAPVLREVGTRFEGRVFHSDHPHEVRQEIVSGDANQDVESDQLTVTTSLSNTLLYAPKVSPNPFTPNADGINDVVNISYKLLRVISAVPISVEVFDLSGRLIKTLYSGADPLGEYEHTWDGRDDFGNFVSPGIYFFRIQADVQSGREIKTGTLSVAY